MKPFISSRLDERGKKTCVLLIDVNVKELLTQGYMTLCPSSCMWKTQFSKVYNDIFWEHLHKGSGPMIEPWKDEKIPLAPAPAPALFGFSATPL
ncbi:hypothetical protein CEXT_797641 [Caerostris extrusa]|uniref:Uncharacterized protein n=1 Tax=Caerostris extrusa TaxID=172846 RepID=A0AAV4MC81_CAEEX|nr:hypothetical protein CEXT_797641 [Caerostris extrusa]